MFVPCCRKNCSARNDVVRTVSGCAGGESIGLPRATDNRRQLAIHVLLFLKNTYNFNAGQSYVSLRVLPRREKRTVQRKTGLEDGLDRRENEGRVIQRQ